MILSDFRSEIVTSTTWVTGLTSVELKIQQFETELNNLERLVTSSFKALEYLEKKTERAIVAMRKELNLVMKWEGAAGNVENSMKNYTVEEMKQVLASQNIFANSIKELKASAKAYTTHWESTVI